MQDIRREVPQTYLTPGWECEASLALGQSAHLLGAP